MKHISITEFHDLLHKGLDIKVLDVREQNEYEEYNIGAKLLPLSAITQMQTDEIENWKDAEMVIVHCKSGMRSMQAIQYLNQMGFDNLYNLEGGIMAWQSQYPNEKLG